MNTEDQSTMAIEYGNKVWRNSAGQIHRDGDLPAVVRADGYQAWYKEGGRHREGGLPTVVYADGTKAWHKEGRLHREGGLPAVVYANGYQAWYNYGVRIDPSSV